MQLTAGDKLGPYEIVSLIGKGGMGEVYKAHDPRTGRDVAIKVSAERFNERFDREVRAVAALNHPNICTLFDVGPNYLVMELVEGQSPQGPLPLETALHYAHQIAAALEEAHDKGIVHRDLKPGNIKIKPDGTVKVLDFGLAKVTTAGAVHSEDSPTISMAATQAGVILGTAAYMAPEQARGKVVDKRADIWAFGVVLYEMLAGKRLFKGEDLTDLLASVVKVDPDLSAAQPQVQRLLKKCLEKDPRRRLRDIGDMNLLLEDRPAAATARPWMGWAAAAVLAAVGLAGWLRPRPEPVSSTTDTRFTIAPAEGLIRIGGGGATPLFSPDGSAVIFRSRGMQLRRMNANDIQPITLRGSVNEPFWSNDSKTLVFADSDSLKKMLAPDGAAEFIAKDPGVLLGGSVSDHGTILFSSIKAVSSLYMVSAGGSEIKLVEVQGLDKGDEFTWPEFLPGSEDFLFLYQRFSGESAVYLATLRDGKAVDPVLLLRNETAASFTPAGGGRILFVRDDNLFAQRLNRSARKLEGEPEMIERGVASAPARGQAHFSVSRNGALAWRPGKAGLSQVTVFDRSGTVVGTAGPPASVQTLRLSPDETHLLVAFDNTAWLEEPDRPGQLRLEQGSLNTLWFPDGSKFLSVVPSSNGLHLVERPVTGTGAINETPVPRGLVRTQDISADGKTLLFNHGVFDTGLFSAPLGPTNEEPKSLIQTGETISNATFSPDAHWILYQVRGQSGGLYVQPFPGPGLRRQISSTGNFPVWRKDGREIVYLTTNQGQTDLWSIPIAMEGSDIKPGTPAKLFPVRLPATTFGDLNFLAVSHDGSRFYMPQAVEQPASSEVIQIRTGGIH